MPKDISVVDTRGNKLAPTYTKRAKQLVKAKRANWINRSTICILENKKEIKDMENQYQPNGPQPMGYEIEKRWETPHGFEEFEIDEISDQYLFNNAKKVIKERHRLISHLVTYIMINIMLFLISVYNGEPWFIFVAFPWGIGLILHFLSFHYKSNPHAVVREYEKQKRALRGRDFNRF